MTLVATLYRFVTIDDPRALRDELSKFLLARGIRGTLLVAPEGINGTVAGTRGDIDALLAWLRRDPRFADIAARESWTDAPPFRRTRVRLKNEIVTLGVPGIDTNTASGSYVEPGDWNALLDDPDVTVIDTRNEYEVGIGTFRGAINPHTRSFRDFPGFVERHLDPARQRKIAMFCTGGIRCEKSTAYLKAQGFDEVYQLRGGILGYLEKIPPERSAWRGECFVFDERVTVDHHLRRGAYDQCHACRMPISAADQRSDRFVAGESCPHCYGARSDAQRRSNRERLRQVRLAERRGEAHLGTGAADVARARREEKRIRRQRRCG